MGKIGNTVIFLSISIVLVASCFAEDSKAMLVSDMEKGLKFTAHGMKEKPEVSISQETASLGSKSLCFEYDGNGKDRVWVTIPFAKDSSAYNVMAFDFYCKNDNGAKFFVLLHQKTDVPGKDAYYSGSLKLEDGRDGWTTVRLIKDRTLCLEKKQGVKGDWSKITAISFGLRREMHGKALFFIDNIRFEKGNSSANILYNASFEKTSNPDVPDGWRRDLNLHPFGRKIWGIDDSVAFHGKKSLRISCKNKYAASLARSHLTRLKKDAQYTFSVYLKSDKPDTKVRISASEIIPSKSDVIVGTEWKRYSLTGKSKAPKRGSVVKITLLSDDSTLWVDAAQLEEGTEATAFKEADNEIVFSDSAKPSKDNKKKMVLCERAGNPTYKLRKIVKAPTIDGKIEKIWDSIQPLSSFVKLDHKGAAEKSTIVKICYDNNAFYILAQAKDDNMERVKALLEKNKRGPFGADLIEIFIRPNHKTPGYYHFAANAKGEKYFTRFKARKIKDDWNGNWEAIGKLNEKDWTVELKIPFYCFDPSENVDSRIGINVCRTSPSDKYSSWSPCFSDGFVFHEPSSFGMAYGFDEDVFNQRRFKVSGLDFYCGKASAFFKNDTGKNMKLNIRFTAIDSKGKAVSTPWFPKDFKPGECSEISENMELCGNGSYKLKMEARDDSGRNVYVSQPLSFRLRKSSVFDFCGTEYNFYTSDEKAKARAYVEVNKKRCDKMRIKYSIQKDGKLAYGPDEIKVASGWNEWAFPVKQLEDGTYRVSVELLEEGKTLAKQESSFIKCKPSRSEVRINQWGNFFVCNMQPVFPYGFFDNSPGSNNLKNWECIMKSVKDANCNVHIAYTWLDPAFEHNLKNFLDIAEKYDQKIWVHLAPAMSYFEPKYANVKKRFINKDDAAAALKRTIEKYKEHPALFGWCTVDEPGNKPSIYTKELMEKYYNTVKKLDPCHPCAPSHVNHMGDFRIYGKALDYSVVPYANNVRSDALLEELLSLKKPVIVNPPCFGGLGDQKSEPTPSGLRVAIYKTIILGARGICSYTYRCSSDVLWNEFAKIGKELKFFGPILLTPDERLRVEISPRKSGIYALLKERGGKYFLFAVNSSSKSVNATFRLSNIPSLSKAKPLFGGPEACIDPKKKAINVEMKKMTTAFYEIE